MGLTQLRTNPQTVLSSEHFFVDTRNLVQTPLGCTVQINEQLKNGVFYWDIANHHSTDFYFPYVQGIPKCLHCSHRRLFAVALLR